MLEWIKNLFRKKRDVRLCMLLLGSAPKGFPISEIRSRLAPFATQDLQIREEGPGLQISFCGEAFTAMIMPIPIPQSEIETSPPPPWHWDNWETEFSRHRAHVFVGHNDVDTQSVERAVNHFRVSHAIAQAMDAVALYWGNAPIFNSKSFVDTISDAQLPLPAFVGSIPVQDGDEVWLESVGLKQFGNSEVALRIQGELDAMQVALLYDIATYCLSARVKPGDTMECGRMLRTSTKRSTISGEKILAVLPQ